MRRIEPSQSFAAQFGKPSDTVITPDHHLGRILPVGRKMTSPTTLSVTDIDGTRHECVAEAFDTTHNLIILLYPVKALGKRRSSCHRLSKGSFNAPSCRSKHAPVDLRPLSCGDRPSHRASEAALSSPHAHRLPDAPARACPTARHRETIGPASALNLPCERFHRAGTIRTDAHYCGRWCAAPSFWSANQ